MLCQVLNCAEFKSSYFIDAQTNQSLSLWRVRHWVLVRNIKTWGLPLARVFSPSAPNCENRKFWFFRRLQVLLKISHRSWLFLRFGYRGVVTQPYVVALLVFGVCPSGLAHVSVSSWAFWCWFCHRVFSDSSTMFHLCGTKCWQGTEEIKCMRSKVWGCGNFC